MFYTHRSEHLHALTKVPHECHYSHLLREALDLAELHHEAVLIREVFQRLFLLLVLP